MVSIDPNLASQQVVVDTSSLDGYTYSLPEQQQQLVHSVVTSELDLSLNQLANVHIGGGVSSSFVRGGVTTHGSEDILSKAARSIMDPTVTAAGMNDDYFPGAKRLKSQNQTGLLQEPSSNQQLSC